MYAQGLLEGVPSRLKRELSCRLQDQATIQRRIKGIVLILGSSCGVSYPILRWPYNIQPGAYYRCYKVSIVVLPSGGERGVHDNNPCSTRVAEKRPSQNLAFCPTVHLLDPHMSGRISRARCR